MKDVFDKKRKNLKKGGRMIRRQRRITEPQQSLVIEDDDDERDEGQGEGGFFNLDKGAQVYFTGRVSSVRKFARRSKRTAPTEGMDKKSSSENDDEGAAIVSMDSEHLRKQVNDLVKRTSSMHSSWLFSLMSSYSLLLYGYGSKRAVVNLFLKKLDGDTVVIEGGHNAVDGEGIVAMVESIIGARRGNNVAPFGSVFKSRSGGTIIALSNLTRYARSVAALVSASGKRINIVVHSFDGPAMRSRAVLEVLCALKCGGANLIVTVDSVNATEVLDWDINACLNFRHVEVHTFATYDAEAKLLNLSHWEDTEASSDKGKLEPIGGVGQILKSLAPRHAELMKLLSITQLSNGDDNSNGVDYNSFRATLKSKMVINSESALKSLLVELLEHRLVVKKKIDGKDYLAIPHSVDTLNMIKNWTA